MFQQYFILNLFKGFLILGIFQLKVFATLGIFATLAIFATLGIFATVGITSFSLKPTECNIIESP